MSTTEKYDLDLTDYSLTGWNQILKGSIEELDEHLHTRMMVTLGETVAEGNVLYLYTDGKYYKAQAAVGKIPARCIAIESGNADDEIRAARIGPLQVTGWTWTIGSKVYVDPTTAGSLTHTKPTAFSQAVGMAIATDTIFVWMEDLSELHYGTSSPPDATNYPDGTVYLQYI